jgi:hypothetical protein
VRSKWRNRRLPFLTYTRSITVSFKKKLTALAVATAVLTVAGIAGAAWLSEGTGDGTATAGEAVDISADGGAVTTAKLYPNGSGDVQLTISNPNPYNVEVTDITNGTGLILSGVESCDAENGVTFTDQLDGSWIVGAADTLDVTLEGAASMDNESDTSCQGKSFTIPVDLVGASTADAPAAPAE